MNKDLLTTGASLLTLPTLEAIALQRGPTSAAAKALADLREGETVMEMLGGGLSIATPVDSALGPRVFFDD